MHRLFLLRHAKAVSQPPPAGGGDHDRPLAEVGRAVLGGVGRAIAEYLDGRPLDVVLCSTSSRTVETIAGITAANPLVAAAEVRLDARLYLAGPERLRKRLAKLPAHVETALVCGHNPGLQEFALELIGAEAAPTRLRHDLPTAGLVVVDLAGSWASIEAGTLRAFVPPT
jgi:phosphohistidine phosphatase